MYYDTLGCSSSELIINSTNTYWFNIALICIRKIQVCLHTQGIYIEASIYKNKDI